MTKMMSFTAFPLRLVCIVAVYYATLCIADSDSCGSCQQRQQGQFPLDLVDTVAAPGMTTKWTLRRATPSDVDTLTWIGINAFPHDPQWYYRYPHAKEFPEDHHSFTKLRYGEWLDSNEGSSCIIMLAECPSLEDPSVTKAVGMSLWRIPSQTSSHDDKEKSTYQCCLHSAIGDETNKAVLEL